MLQDWSRVVCGKWMSHSPEHRTVTAANQTNEITTCPAQTHATIASPVADTSVTWLWDFLPCVPVWVCAALRDAAGLGRTETWLLFGCRACAVWSLATTLCLQTWWKSSEVHKLSSQTECSDWTGFYKTVTTTDGTFFHQSIWFIDCCSDL